MNFFDFGFIFVFVPLVWIGAALARCIGQRAQYAFLILASLLFYWSWNTAAPTVLIVSIGLNYLLGQRLYGRPHKIWLALGVAANLLTLGYYKYTLFVVTNIGELFALPPMSQIILPLGISFFTFQQISYLVDSHRGETPKHDFLSYALFISFFPHLVAGPIVLQGDVLRQLGRKWALLLGPRHLALGLALFSVGLAKKIIVADTFAQYAIELFAKAHQSPLSTAEAWQAGFAYTFQIYFDFSGYSDMAIGLAYMLGLRLPFNFNSPYKSLNISEFWRRWHMSLSRFLKRYLYIPLGGNRRGRFRTYQNLLIVMMLGGLWHGASWTFVLWGTLHGLLLVGHVYWKRLDLVILPSPLGRRMAWFATFIVIVFTWIPFRAPDLATTASVWLSMIGLGPSGFGGMPLSFAVMALAAVMGCLLLPNSQQLVFGESRIVDDRYPAGTNWLLRYRMTPAWAVAFGCLFTVALACEWQMRTPPEFIYFNF